MSNNLPLGWQRAIFVDLIRRAPFRAVVLLLLIGIVFFGVFANHDPIVFRYQANVANQTSKVETLLIVNPNIEKRDIAANFSQIGEPYEFGPDAAYAIDMLSGSHRFAKFNVLDGSVATFTILNPQVDRSGVRIPGTIEGNVSEGTLRKIAVAYITGLILTINTVLVAISVFVGLFPLFKPGKSISSTLS